MDKALTVEAVRTKYHQLHPLMTERLRRQWAACEAESLGRGGPSIVAEATGLSGPRSGPVAATQATANQPRDDLAAQRVRAPGGGRHLVEQKDSAILTDLQVLVDSSTRGDRNHLCAGPPRVYGGLPRN